MGIIPESRQGRQMVPRAGPYFSTLADAPAIKLVKLVANCGFETT